MSGVFNLADVFELVIDGFNQGPLPDNDLGLAQLRRLHKSSHLRDLKN